MKLAQLQAPLTAAVSSAVYTGDCFVSLSSSARYAAHSFSSRVFILFLRLTFSNHSFVIFLLGLV
jgi:hypothetical protein